MIKLIFHILILCGFLDLSFADSPRKGRFLAFNKTIVNCASFGRAKNQHSSFLIPFTDEGPYFVPDNPLRSNLIDGEPGIPLVLKVKIIDSRDCSPIPNLYVHIWSVNSTGNYSGVNESEYRTHGQLRVKSINDSRFLRGHQMTDKEGTVTFKTIVPGWYGNRTLHIHIEVYTERETREDKVTFIGQFYFSRDIAERLKSQYPYSLNKDRMTYNDEDDDYIEFDGKHSILKINPDRKCGWRSTVRLAIDPTVTINAY